MSVRYGARVLCASRTAAVLALVLFVGCVGVDAVAPAVTPAMARVGAGGGSSPSDLEVGRVLLTRRCTSCHALEPIARYSVEEWKASVAEMAERSGLNAQEARQVAAYLCAARQSLGGQTGRRKPETGRRKPETGNLKPETGNLNTRAPALSSVGKVERVAGRQTGDLKPET